MAEAKIRIGIEGISGVRATLGKVVDDLTNLEIKASSISGVIKGVGEGFVRMGVDIAKAMNDMKPINFAAAADSFKATDDMITRMAVKGGKNVTELTGKLRDFGTQAGVGLGRFAAAAKDFDQGTFSGIDDASEAMRQLGIYAEDTGRSIEQMEGIGETLTAKLGVPTQKVGEELRKIKIIANDMGMAAGFLGIEQTLQRLAPLLAHIQGGASRGAAENAVLRKKGYSQQVAEDVQQSVYGALESADPWRVRASTREVMGAKFEPYARGPNGELQITRQGIKALHKFAKKRPLNALTGLFGGGIRGERNARAFLDDLDPDEVEKEEQHATEEAQTGGMVEKVKSVFSTTPAGQRVRTDIEHEKVKGEVGQWTQEQRDKRNKRTTAKERAVVDTIIGYMPPIVQDAAAVATATWHKPYIGVQEAAGAAYDYLTGGGEKPKPDDSQQRAIENLPDAVKAGVKAGVKEGLAEESGKTRLGNAIQEGVNTQIPKARVN